MVRLDLDLNLLSDEGLKCYLILKEEIAKAQRPLPKMETPKIPSPPPIMQQQEQDEDEYDDEPPVEEKPKKKWLV